MAATIKDLARETGLGVATISKYLNGGSVLKKNRVLIERAVTKLDYRVNTLARSLKANRTMTVGVIIPSFSALFFAKIATCIQDELSAFGYSILLCDSDTKRNGTQDAVEFLSDKQVDGIIAATTGDGLSEFVLAQKHDIPVVLFDCVPRNRIYDTVVTDNRESSRRAVSYLLSMGHLKCGILYGANETYTAKERLAGYVDAYREIDLEPDMELFEISPYTEKAAYDAFLRLYQRRPDMTAIFTTCYQLTIGAIMAIQKFRIAIPERLSFIGFDDLLLTEIIQPKLTMVSQPIGRIGSAVAHHMLKLMEGLKPSGKTILIPNRMVMGASVRRI